MVNSLTTNRLRDLLPGQWNDVDSMLEHFFGPSTATSIRSLAYRGSSWEDENALHIELDVPGVKREDVELTYEKGQLQITTERKSSEEKREGLVDQRQYGRLVRTVTLPESIDPDTIEADLADGVLHVRVSKRPEAQPKRIELK